MTRVRWAIAALGVVLVAVLVMAAPRIWDAAQIRTGWGLPDRIGPPLLIVAHRGDLEAHPEDTTEAIWAAAALRPDGIEMDVHRSASGTWYVIHDPMLDRTTDGHGHVSELSDDAIDAARIDAGLGFRADSDSLHVPRLLEVLDGLHEFEGTIYLDLQHAESGDAAELVDLTQGMRVAIICRSAADAAAVKARDNSIETLLRVFYLRGPSVDGLLADASIEASPRLMGGWPLPVTVYVDESQFADDEYALLRSAWATGVKAFITNHLEDALTTRDGFVTEAPVP
jgi:glycerophosphoryl diester phosphodiesterase